MTGEPQKRRRIVLVDDEEALAWSLSSRLERVRPQDRVLTANDGETALRLLADMKADLLIADVRMPGMSGIDLILGARAADPTLPVIVMTAFKSAEVERLSRGAFTAFLEKPFEFEELTRLVTEALTPAKTGFSGAIFVQTLPDVVQLYVLSSATGMLRIRHLDGQGEIWFERGAIRHAETEYARGDEAFYEIMTWDDGEFSMTPGVQTVYASITSNWQELLIESCRRLDERTRKAGSSPPRGWTQRPPSSDEELSFEFGDLEPATKKRAILDAHAATPLAAPPQIESPRLETLPTDPRSTHANEPRPSQPNPGAPMNIKDSLSKLNSIDGFVGAAVCDMESGMLLGAEGGGNLNLEVAAAGNSEVLKAKRKTMNNLGLKDSIEDFLISLGTQYHLIRPLRSRPNLFFYVALDRKRANLALARIALGDVEKDLQV